MIVAIDREVGQLFRHASPRRDETLLMWAQQRPGELSQWGVAKMAEYLAERGEAHRSGPMLLGCAVT